MEQQGKPKEITILALGGAGCRILRALAEAPAAQSLRLLAADTDAESLARSGVAENCRLLAGARWRGGRGCGGNVIDGQRAMAHERSTLEQMLSGSAMLMVIGGLGGGTASGGVPVVLSVARKLGIPTMFLMTLPFAL